MTYFVNNKISNTLGWRIVRTLSFLLIAEGACAGLAMGQNRTATSLTASASAVSAGTPVTFSAAVTSAGRPVTAGQVQFCDATVKFCQGAAVLAHAQLTGSGTATSRLILGPGAHSIQAVFNGTKLDVSSSSAIVQVAVSGTRPTSTVLGLSGTVGAYSLTAGVAGLGVTPLSHTVSFFDSTDGNVLLGTAALGASQVSPGFSAISGPATGNGPYALATGDFNGDGRPDVATADLYASTVTIQLGNGDGTFTSSTISLSSGAYPAAIVAGDFNNDGKLDLAVAQSSFNDVKILLGNGDGTFPAGASFATGNSPYGLVAVDGDRDGQIDLAAINQGDNTVTILIGKGDGTFAAKSAVPATGNNPYSIASGDFNSDGIPDLAVANFYDDDVTLLVGNGDGTFTPGAALGTGIYPVAVAATDLNGDGHADLVAVSQYSQTVTIFMGDGKGNFTPQPATPLTGKTPDSIAVGDFNGDGRQDLAVASSNSNAVDVYLGNGDGTFNAAVAIAAGSGPKAVAAFDANGDGLTDMVVGDGGGSQTQTLLNQTSVYATAVLSKVVAPGAASQSVVATYSGDANYAPSASASVSLTGTRISSAVQIGTPSYTVGVGQPLQLFGFVTPSKFGNLSPTGQTSLFDNGKVTNLVPLSSTAASYSLQYATAGSHKLTISYVGDANFLPSISQSVTLNVVAVSTSSTILAVSSNSVAHGTPITLIASVTSGGNPVTRGTVNFCNAKAARCQDVSILGTAQLTSAGSAVLKLALPVGSDSVRAVFLGTGVAKASNSNVQIITVTGTYTPKIVLSSTGTAGKYSFTASLTDSSWQANANPSLALIDTSNKNASLATAALAPQRFSFVPGTTVTGTGAKPWAVATGDFNGDGKMDAAVGDSNTGALSVLLGNGDGTFLVKSTPINLGSPYAMIARDFNGDGKLDLAVTDLNSNNVEVLLGNGDGTFAMKSRMVTGIFPESIVVGDFNHDGILDIACANYEGGGVGILLGKGDGTYLDSPVFVGSPTQEAYGLIAADFDQDGNLDLVYNDYATQTLAIAYGLGDGTFEAPAAISTRSEITGMAVADFNGDGLPDIAIDALLDFGDFLVLQNLGHRSFNTYVPQLTPAPFFAVGMTAVDLNGDGHADVVAVDSYGNALYVYYNDGKGGFHEVAQTLTGTASPASLGVADFDQDGGADLLVPQNGLGDLSVWLNRSQATASFGSVTLAGAGTHTVQAVLPAASVYTVATSNALSLSGTTLQ